MVRQPIFNFQFSIFNSRLVRIAALVVRMLLGIFFIASAILKLIDIDRFEVYIFSYNIFSLNTSFLVARLVIVCELLVGIGLVANLFNRLVDACALLMLVGFTFFMGYACLIGRHDSCHCMGALVDIDPTGSILKNALLILLLLFAKGARPWAWRPRWFVWLPVVLAPTVTVFILSAPDNWLFGPSEEIYNAEEFATAIQPDGILDPLNLDQGRHVLAFLTPGCPFCRMADEKLTHICRRNGLDSAAFVYFCPSSDSTVTPLTLDTTTFIRPCHLIPSLSYALITYGQRPIIFLTDQGKVVGTCHYRNIDERRIANFIKPSANEKD
jgi:uncharacterized membrane protein YphA (DoxX/SURF4 family)